MEGSCSYCMWRLEGGKGDRILALSTWDSGIGCKKEEAECLLDLIKNDWKLFQILFGLIFVL